MGRLDAVTTNPDRMVMQPNAELRSVIRILDRPVLPTSAVCTRPLPTAQRWCRHPLRALLAVLFTALALSVGPRTQILRFGDSRALSESVVRVSASALCAFFPSDNH